MCCMFGVHFRRVEEKRNLRDGILAQATRRPAFLLEPEPSGPFPASPIDCSLLGLPMTVLHTLRRSNCLGLSDACGHAQSYQATLGHNRHNRSHPVMPRSCPVYLLTADHTRSSPGHRPVVTRSYPPREFSQSLFPVAVDKRATSFYRNALDSLGQRQHLGDVSYVSKPALRKVLDTATQAEYTAAVRRV